jgi:hypothetical protein
MESLPKDVLVYLALELNLVDIVSLCKSNKNIDNKICKNQYFWRNKINKEYPNNSQNDLITKAIQADSLDMFNFLIGTDTIDNDTIDNNTAIYYVRLASAYGALDIFKYLERYGIDIHQNQDEFYRHASCYGKLNIVRYLIENKKANIRAYDYDALIVAAYQGHLDVVKYIIENLKQKIPIKVKRQILQFQVLKDDLKDFIMNH